MKKFTTAFLALMLVQGAAYSQSCLPEGITFTTQNQIDSFQVNYPGCTEILGGMTISGSDITNLQGLDVLTTIFNGFVIENNPVLTSLTGLNNITHAWGSLTIEHNDALTSLAGLEGLTRIEITLTIGFNTALSSLDGLENLASTSGGIFVYYNDVLTSLSGLQGLTSIAGDLYFDILEIAWNLFSWGGDKTLFTSSFQRFMISHVSILEFIGNPD